jgi:hypothetical protein
MPRHESYHGQSTQTCRRVTRKRYNAEPRTHHTVRSFRFSTSDSPLYTSPAMLAALLKLERRLSPSLRPGTVHPIAMNSD